MRLIFEKKQILVEGLWEFAIKSKPLLRFFKGKSFPLYPMIEEEIGFLKSVVTEFGVELQGEPTPEDVVLK